MRCQAIDKWQTRREAGTQSHGALRASRATDAPCSGGRSDRRVLEEVLIVRRLFGASTEALIIVILVFGLLAFPVLAAKGGNGGGGHGGGKPTAGTGTISLVLVDSTDGLAHYGQWVTFNVSTTATTEPWVNLKCWQSGTLVAEGWNGYFERSITGVNFGLYSPAWTSGAADCTAYLTTPQKSVLGWTSFHVEP
jgi:hypothetical protein